MLENQRALFDLPDDVAYLNCAYMSPLMNKVRDAGHRAIASKVHPWTVQPEDFFTRSQAARTLFARIINAHAHDIAIIPAASYGVAVAARNIAAGKGRDIVMLAEEHSSNVYSWLEMARRTGAALHMVTRAEATHAGGAVDFTTPVLDAITDRTAIVALPNCHWMDGAMVDLVKVGEKARAHGAKLVVDITQSGGAMAFDVQAVRPDFLVDACYKWMLGPYSLGFLYAAPEFHGGEPLEENWIGRAGSEDFSQLVNYRDDYQPGAQRFDMGERANFQLMPMAAAAMEQLLDWGIERIHEALSHKTTAIAARAGALGLSSLPIGQRAGHYLGLTLPGGPPEGLIKALQDRNVFVSLRGDAIRVTPHLYTTDSDIDRLFGALEAVL